MLAFKRRTLVLSVIAVGIVLAGVAGIVAVESLRWRAAIVSMKLFGKLDTVTWGDLIYMVDPRSGHWLAPLVETPNPYAVVKNPRHTERDIAAGKAIYESRCTACHDATAGGHTAPALTGRRLRHGDSDWAIFNVVRHGVPATAMVAQPLSRDDTWNVIAYIRELARQQAKANGGALADDNQRIEFAAVSNDRLLLADTQAGQDGWLTYSGTLDGSRYSPLTQIDRETVAGLRVQWIKLMPSREGQRVETTPLVNGDIMLVTAPPAKVQALSARTGKVLWEYSRPVPDDVSVCCWLTNRGVALHGERVYLGTVDAHLIALDAHTGKQLWDAKVADYKEGYSITSAPLAVEGLVITGNSGGDYPTSGFIAAYDAATGKEKWRFQTIPPAGEPGNDSWGNGSWRDGGAATWLTGVYDAKQRLVIWGVGNPAPDFNAEVRPGDNLYSNSAVALHVDTGKLAWHFQFTPGDDHDWDSVQIPVLADLEWQGASRPLVMWANRNGFFYVLDRTNGKYLLGKPFVKQTWATGLDPNGRPIRIPEASPSERGSLVYPSVAGAANWWSPTFNPTTRLFYVPILEKGGIFYRSGVPEPKDGELYIGSRGQGIPDEPHVTSVIAIDPLTGDIAWRRSAAPRMDTGEMGGLLGTAGQLVFAADRSELMALDAATGAVLWKFDTGQTISAAPITYQIEGRQYVAIAAGPLLLTFGLPEAVAPSGASATK